MRVSPRRAIFGHLNFRKCSETVSFFTFSLANVRFATAACNFSTSGLEKVFQARGVFKSFHLQMCVSPQRRAIFPPPDFKKCSKPDVFCTFSLANVRFATAACNFSTSQLQKVPRDRQFFSNLTSKCAFRHSGMQILISLLSTYLRIRRFNRPTLSL